MALKTGATRPIRRYPEAQDIARALKRYSENQATGLASGTDWSVIRAIIENLKAQRSRLLAAKSTAGIQQFAKDQENDQTYDFGAEVDSVVAAIDAVLTDIVTRIPKDGNDYVLAEELNTSTATITFRTFTPAQVAPVVTLLNALAATISDS